MSQTPPPPPPDPAQDPSAQQPPPPPPPPPADQPAYGQPAPGQPAYGQPAYGQPAPGQPQYAAQPGVPRPGELLDRFLARLIDGILLAIVNGVIVSAIVVGAVMGESGGYGGFGTGASYAAGAVSAVLSTVIYLGYFAFMESSRGQTVGKMILKLRTTGPDGGNPTMEQALRRNIWAGLSILGIVPFLGILGGLAQLVAVIMIAVGINSDPVNRQAWHDRFAGGTRVRKVG